MSTIQIVKAANDAAGNEPVVAPVTVASHATGVMESDSALSSSLAAVAQRFLQKIAPSPIEDFLCRFVEVATVTINEANTPIAPVVTIDPWALFLANTHVADKIANFALIQGSLEVLIITAIPGSCYGSYVWSALPNGGAVNATFDCAQVLVPMNCMQVDHWTRIDCADATNCVLQLPWVWPFDFAPLPTGPAAAWALTLTCLSPLGTGIASGVTTGHMRVFVRLLPDYQMVVPTFQGQKRSGALVSTAAVKEHVDRARESKVVSKTAGAIAAVADKMSGIPIVGGAAAAVGAVAHGVAEVASWFGFTRHADPRHPLPVTQRSVSSVSVMDGMDSSDLAALSVDQRISTDPLLVGGPAPDVAANASLFARWTLVKHLTWTTVQTTDTEIGEALVTPFTGLQTASMRAALPVAGYVGAPFEYWRGDMEYLIVIPVSKFHRGSVQVYWIPASGVAPSTVTNTTKNVVMDVSSNSEAEFLVGYAREAPYLQKGFITADVAIAPVGLTNGSLRFRVVNPLISQNTSASVRILIFARGGANMDFAQLSNAIVYPTAAAGAYTTRDLTIGLFAAQGALGDDGAPETLSNPLMPSSGVYPGEEVLWGERVSSVRALMQKPCRVLYSSDVTWAGRLYVPVGGKACWTGESGLLRTCWTTAAYYRCLFTGFAASERWKMIPRGETVLGAATWSLPLITPPVYGNFTSQLAPMTFCGPNKGAEVTIPYYQPSKFLLGRREYSVGTTWGNRANVLYNGYREEDVADEIALYYSFGPDIRLTCFRQCPQVAFVGGATAFLAYTFWQTVTPPALMAEVAEEALLPGEEVVEV